MGAKKKTDNRVGFESALHLMRFTALSLILSPTQESAVMNTVTTVQL